MRTKLCAAVLLLLVGACSPDLPGETVDEDALLVPSLDSVAPTSLRVGDKVKVIGKDFPDDGSLSLFLDGTYVDINGSQHPFTGEIELDVLNSSVAEFAFEEIFFHPSRDQIGTWSGSASLIARRAQKDQELEEQKSPTSEISLRVDPSIILTRMRSADVNGCPDVNFSTTADQNIEFGFKALGMGSATAQDPWNVKMSFVSPDVKVRYVVPDAFDFWPITGPISDEVSKLVDDGTHNVEFAMADGNSVVLDPTTTARRVRVSPAVKIGQDMHDEVILGTLVAGQPPEGGKRTATFVLEIGNNKGETLRRVVSLDIWSEIEIATWDGTEEVVERYEPHAVSGCFPGGDIGSDYTYAEGESLSRSRNVNIKWNAQVASSMGFNIGLPVLGVSSNQTWTESFGVDISETLTSQTHVNQNLKKFILPKHYGVSYRQLERLERRVDVIYHNACGQSGIVGEAELTNWNFAFDIAQGKSCPPQTNLPPAELL